MALLTAAELKASKEAEDAGVDGVADEFATDAIAVAEAYVLRLTGYTSETFDFEDPDQDFVLARQAVLLLAVRALAGTGIDGMPVPPGGYLTNVSSEATSFSFYTPTDSTTGYADVDRLIDMIAKGPFLGSSGIVSVQLQGPYSEEADPDLAWSDLL